MKGYKTVVVGILSVLAGLATARGITLDADAIKTIQDNVDIVFGSGMAIYGAVMVLLRAITDSPIFRQGK